MVAPVAGPFGAIRCPRMEIPGGMGKGLALLLINCASILTLSLVVRLSR